MSEELLIKYASPTLAGLKPGSLFSVVFSDEEDAYESIREVNRKLVPKGLCLISLRQQKGRTLLYLFRPSVVEKKLANTEAREILSRYGYHGDTVGRHLTNLIGRLRNGKEFPHEIGLFLGYPPEDVLGFIENKAENCKCIGTWKVYGDVEEAQKTFRRFRHCTEVYSKQWKNGIRLERLIVPA